MAEDLTTEKARVCHHGKPSREKCKRCRQVDHARRVGRLGTALWEVTPEVLDQIEALVYPPGTRNPSASVD